MSSSQMMVWMCQNHPKPHSLRSVTKPSVSDLHRVISRKAKLNPKQWRHLRSENSSRLRDCVDMVHDLGVVAMTIDIFTVFNVAVLSAHTRSSYQHDMLDHRTGIPSSQAINNPWEAIYHSTIFLRLSNSNSLCRLPFRQVLRAWKKNSSSMHPPAWKKLACIPSTAVPIFTQEQLTWICTGKSVSGYMRCITMYATSRYSVWIYESCF